MLVLSEDDVDRLLPIRDAIDFVREAFILFSEGRITCPQRLPLPLDSPGAVLFSMPAFDGRRYAGVKLVAVQPANTARGLPVVRGTYHLLDAATCETLAVLGAARLTAIRTGAAGGLAAELCARESAGSVALFGAGAQAETQLLAVAAVRPIHDVYVWSRSGQRAVAFIAAMERKIRVRFHYCEDPAVAVRQAALIITATKSTHPLFRDRDVQPGTHITAVGAFTADMQELPDDTVARSTVFVDSTAAAWEEAGDLLGPLRRGIIARTHIRAEIGAVAAGLVPGRSSAEEITLFKSVGLAAQDLVCAAAVYRRAQEASQGVQATL